MHQDPNIIIPKIEDELTKIDFTSVPSLIAACTLIFTGVVIVGTQVLDWGSLLEVIRSGQK